MITLTILFLWLVFYIIIYAVAGIGSLFVVGAFLISFLIYHLAEYVNVKRKDEKTNGKKVYEGRVSKENAENIGDEYTSKLRELRELLHEGMITETEYEETKRKILGLD